MILGTRLYDELDQERIICITGSLSGGKTRLAFDIALFYWRRGWRVMSNVPHNFENWMGREEFDLYKSFVIIDEGGEYVRQAKVASLVTRSAGKANYYAVFAGKRLPHKNLQDIVIKPRFDFYQKYLQYRPKRYGLNKYRVPIEETLVKRRNNIFDQHLPPPATKSAVFHSFDRSQSEVL